MITKSFEKEFARFFAGRDPNGKFVAKLPTRRSSSAVKTLAPDVVILDITMPGTSGLEVAQRIKGMQLPPRILIFTMHDSERLAAEVRDVGAHGYVLKSQAARDLVVAIEKVLGGDLLWASGLRLNGISR